MVGCTVHLFFFGTKHDFHWIKFSTINLPSGNNFLRQEVIKYLQYFPKLLLNIQPCSFSDMSVASPVPMNEISFFVANNVCCPLWMVHFSFIAQLVFLWIRSSAPLAIGSIVIEIAKDENGCKCNYKKAIIVSRFGVPVAQLVEHCIGNANGCPGNIEKVCN